ncbi:hypothetical protein DMENIID0001_059340 [Sergentomyia squamirostris]
MESSGVNGKVPTLKLDTLDNFIKKLAEKLPENSSNGRLEIRRTSDLFDTLNQALSTPPQIPLPTVRKQVQIEIQSAEGLPRFLGRIQRKKSKKHKGHNAAKCVNQEPSAFVTFEASSAEGADENPKVFTTEIVEKNCNPCWNANFSVFLNAELQNLPLVVWRRTSSNANLEIGTTTVNLTKTSDICDILDASGQIFGKLKVKITQNPASDQEKTPTEVEDHVKMDSDDSLTADLDPTLSNLMFPLASGNGFASVSFSRALKRKFTELEEISQRLKARLSDITGPEENPSDFDPDDEFERDLNTTAEEEDEVEAGNSSGEAYAWLGLDQEHQRQFIHTEVTKELFVDVTSPPEEPDIAHIETALEQTAISDGTSPRKRET